MNIEQREFLEKLSAVCEVADNCRREMKRVVRLLHGRGDILVKAIDALLKAGIVFKRERMTMELLDIMATIQEIKKMETDLFEEK